MCGTNLSLPFKSNQAQPDLKSFINILSKPLPLCKQLSALFQIKEYQDIALHCFILSFGNSFTEIALWNLRPRGPSENSRTQAKSYEASRRSIAPSRPRVSRESDFFDAAQSFERWSSRRSFYCQLETRHLFRTGSPAARISKISLRRHPKRSKRRSRGSLVREDNSERHLNNHAHRQCASLLSAFSRFPGILTKII